MNRSARLIRCYTNQPLNGSDSVELNERSSHHLSRVLRVKEQQAVELFNGDGMNYRGTVTATGKRVTVNVNDVHQNDAESPLHIRLIQGIARGDKMDTIIQKATELGVREILAIYTAQSVSKLDKNREAKKMQHWQHIMVSACEQSGRSVLPSLAPVATLDEAIQSQQNDDVRLVLSPQGVEKARPPQNTSNITLLVGPEAGFDPNEVAAAQHAGFTAVTVGPRIMRTETAGPAVIAILQAQFGDMG